MDFNGRPMTGMLYVGRPTIDDDASLTAWVIRSYDFASSLPAKKANQKPAARRNVG
jgi:hypothetical protein